MSECGDVPEEVVQTRNWCYFIRKADKVRDILRKFKSIERPPIDAFLLAVEDLGIFGERDREERLMDVQWHLFQRVFRKKSSCLMKLLKESGCIYVESMKEYDPRHRADVILRVFKLKQKRWGSFHIHFIDTVVQNIIYARPQEKGHVNEVLLTEDCLTTEKFRHGVCADRYRKRAQFQRILYLFEWLTKNNWGHVVPLLRDSFVECFPEISYLIYFFSY